MLYQKSNQFSSQLCAILWLPRSYVTEIPKAFCTFYTSDDAERWLGWIARRIVLVRRIDFSRHVVQVLCRVDFWQDKRSDRRNAELSSGSALMIFTINLNHLPPNLSNLSWRKVYLYRSVERRCDPDVVAYQPLGSIDPLKSAPMWFNSFVHTSKKSFSRRLALSLSIGAGGTESSKS